MRHRKIFNSIQQRGQMLVFFALMIPIILLFVGLALDIGWYYLNVSRLQNAADAAALAGANALLETKTSSTSAETGSDENQPEEYDPYDNYEQTGDELGDFYYTYLLTSNELPADVIDYEKIWGSQYHFGNMNYYLPLEKVKDSLKVGRDTAEAYTRKNLMDSGVVSASSADTESGRKNFSATDGWSISSKDGDKKVTGKVNLYVRSIDIKNDILGEAYYVVDLSETIQHFFLPGWFKDMVAPVRAVAKLGYHDEDLLSRMFILARTMVIDNWEHQKYYSNPSYKGVWGGSIQDYAIHYEKGDTYRTEKASINGNAAERDSLFIDMRAELMDYHYISDWDLGYVAPTNTKYDTKFIHGWSNLVGADRRILYTADFGKPYDTRYPRAGRSDIVDPDVLWVRIESDPIKDLSYIPGKKNHTRFNTVRQVTVNVNQSNTGFKSVKVNGENKTIYKYRPYCIFYTGPERIDKKTVQIYDEDSGKWVTKSVRISQPFVLNLNADFNGILFVPNSPCIINGNGHAWYGFVIAKEFVAAKTIDDFKSERYTEITDVYGNTLAVAPDSLVRKSFIDALEGDYTNAVDEYGNIVRFDNTKPVYLRATRVTNNAKIYVEPSKVCNTKDKTNQWEITIDGLTSYVDASKLTDSATETNKVTVLVNGEKKYAPDITDEATETNTLAVQPVKYVDNYKSYDSKWQEKNYIELTDSDGKTFLLYIGDYIQTKYVDSSKLYSEKTTSADFEVIYNNEAKYVSESDLSNKQTSDNQVSVLIRSYKFFRKVKDADRYFNEDTTDFYQQVWQELNGEKINPTMVDKNGNIQTKPLPENSSYKSDLNPLDSGWNKQAYGREYRTEDYEVIYKREAFNLWTGNSPTDNKLSSDYSPPSHYTSFKVDLLKRTNYLYLDSDTSIDMFFTARRAHWID